MAILGVEVAYMSKSDMDSLSRPIQSMPDWVCDALEAQGLMAAYNGRPAYQRNDYLGWINRAKRVETRQRRLNQMLDELRRGGVYMKMTWRPGRTSHQ